MITRTQLRWLGLFTLLGMGGLGLIIIYISDGTPFLEMIRGHFSILSQIGIGLAFGTISAFVAWGLIRMPFMAPVERKYRTLIGSIAPRWPDIIFLSISAGVGEELLFRGGIQPHLGVWPTAIIFVALHGYLNPMDWRVTLYGLFMTIAIAIIGKLYVHVGAVTAIVAHTMIDIVLLRALTKAHEAEQGNDQEEELDSGL